MSNEFELDNETLRKYHLSRKNLLKIARYMKYEVPDDLDMELEDFIKKYSEFSLNDMKEDMTILLNEDKPNSLMLKWHLQHKLGVSVADTAEYMEHNKIMKAIIVADGGVTSSSGCNDILQNLRIAKRIIIEVWRLDESMIFVPDHELVPEHRICTLKEKKHLFKVCGFKSKDDMPYIKKDDIMVRYLGAVKNQVIETKEKCVSDPTLYILHYMIVV